MRQFTLLLFYLCLPTFIFGMKPISKASPVDYRIENSIVIDTLPSYTGTEETEEVESEKGFASFLSFFAKFSAIFAAGGFVMFMIGLLINTTGLLAGFGGFLWIITFPLSVLSVFLYLLITTGKKTKTKKQKKQLKQAAAILITILLAYILLGVLA